MPKNSSSQAVKSQPRQQPRGSNGGAQGKNNRPSAQKSGSQNRRQNSAPAQRNSSPSRSVRASAVASSDIHTLADQQLRDAIAQNRRRMRVLIAIIGLAPSVTVGALVGVIGGGLYAVIAFAVVAGLEAVVVRRTNGSDSLGISGLSPLQPSHAPALFTLIEGLCATMGVSAPKVMFLDDPIANSCTFNGANGAPTLLVTRGLLERLDVIALEGVVAHELSHIKRHDTVVTALVLRSVVPVAALLKNEKLVHRALGGAREYRADQAAVMAVRYPPGLMNALAVMATNPAPSPKSYFASKRFGVVRWLWIDPLIDGSPMGELDAVAVRRDALGEW